MIVGRDRHKLDDREGSSFTVWSRDRYTHSVPSTEPKPTEKHTWHRQYVHAHEQGQEWFRPNGSRGRRNEKHTQGTPEIERIGDRSSTGAIQSIIAGKQLRDPRKRDYGRKGRRSTDTLLPKEEHRQDTWIDASSSIANPLWCTT